MMRLQVEHSSRACTTCETAEDISVHSIISSRVTGFDLPSGGVVPLSQGGGKRLPPLLARAIKRPNPRHAVGAGCCFQIIRCRKGGKRNNGGGDIGRGSGSPRWGNSLGVSISIPESFSERDRQESVSLHGK